MKNGIADVLEKARRGMYRPKGTEGKKLDASDVDGIRKARAAGVPVREIAKGAGVTIQSVYDVLKGRTWRGTQPPVPTGDQEPDQRPAKLGGALPDWMIRAGALHPLHRKAEKVVDPGPRVRKPISEELAKELEDMVTPRTLAL